MDTLLPPHIFLTSKEAAEWLRVDPDTLANWRAQNQGPPYRKHGGKVVYRLDELEAWSLKQMRDEPVE